MGSIWISCKIFFHPWIWNKVLNVKIFWVCPFGGFGQIFLKQIAEKLVVFRGKILVKVAKERFHGKRTQIIFFCSVFSENLPTKMTIFTCYFGVNAWNTVVVFIEKALMYEPLVWMIPPRVWTFNQKIREAAILVGQVSLKPYKKKSGFPIKSEQKRVNQSSASKG